MRAVHLWLLSRASRRRVVFAFVAVLAVQAAFALARTDPAVNRVVSSMPDAHLGYDGAGLAELVRTLAENPTATLVTYALDVLMPVTAAAFFSLWLASLLVATGRQHTGWRRVVALPLVAAGVDLLENAMVLTLVALYPSELVKKFYVVLNTISAAKWTLHSTGIVCVVMLLIAYFRRDRARASA